MNKKSILIKFAVVLICVLGLTLSAAAQKRKTTTRKTAPKSAPVSTIANTAEIRDGAGKVSIQLKNVSKFIYLLGGIARNIEDIDKEAKLVKNPQSKVTQKVTQNELNKKNVIASIRNLRAGLAALEVEFRTKPALRPYLLQIQGISDMSGVSEDQALAGQFTESGKTLLLVVEKLSDTLAAMP